ncbi:hypothetical protein GCM10009631_11640 [Corynebacterium glaucum]
MESRVPESFGVSKPLVYLLDEFRSRVGFLVQGHKVRKVFVSLSSFAEFIQNYLIKGSGWRYLGILGADACANKENELPLFSCLYDLRWQIEIMIRAANGAEVIIATFAHLSPSSQARAED